MLIAHDHRAARCTAPTALAIGNFDGVHLGHRHIFSRVLAAARVLQGQSVALTFDPHPTRVLAPERAAAVITPLDRKLELLSETGVDIVVVERFDLARSAQNAEGFVREVIVGLKAREVFVGADFRFGHDRTGDGTLLNSLGEPLGFRTEVVPALLYQSEVISSSRVRKALAAGDLNLAKALLGRPFDLDGLVVQGHQRGRSLGFPTANLHTVSEALPREGVYAVRTRVLGDPPRENSLWLGGVANLGSRPTFSAGPSLEVYLFDTHRDLYDRSLRVQFVARLRDEQRFNSALALKAQITDDISTAREILASESQKP